MVFSHAGDLLASLNLDNPADSVTHIYAGFTHRLNPDGSVTFYLCDRNLANVRQYRFSSNAGLSFVNEINLGHRMETSLSDVLYTERFGLWAIERKGPHLYRLAEDLSRVIFEVDGEQFSPRSLFQLHKICIFPDRLVVFEQMGNDSGIISLALNPYSGKRESEVNGIIPFKFALNQNYPNPFNPNTVISFEIPKANWTKLQIFNILGQKVRTLVDEYKPPGRYTIIWDSLNDSGETVASGIYFAQLSSGDRKKARKMVLLK